MSKYNNISAGFEATKIAPLLNHECAKESEGNSINMCYMYFSYLEDLCYE